MLWFMLGLTHCTHSFELRVIKVLHPQILGENKDAVGLGYSQAK